MVFEYALADSFKGITNGFNAMIDVSFSCPRRDRVLLIYGKSFIASSGKTSALNQISDFYLH